MTWDLFNIGYKPKTNNINCKQLLSDGSKNNMTCFNDISRSFLHVLLSKETSRVSYVVSLVSANLTEYISLKLLCCAHYRIINSRDISREYFVYIWDMQDEQSG